MATRTSSKTPSTTKKPAKKAVVKKKTSVKEQSPHQFNHSPDAKHLVIVESPAKCSTISKYLGKNFTVMASYGHIAALAKKNMGIDIDNGYNPHYEIDPDKKKVVSALKAAMKQVDQVWIATDEDREGEAIGWHVARALGLKIETTPRITFHEITKPALEHAVKNPRILDIDLINAQQARRVLDRLVWFELSPLLWKKVKTWLSAGRVQSVAVRVIVDREKEIQQFKATPTLQSTAVFSTDSGNFSAKWDATYSKVDDARSFLTQASHSKFIVESVIAKPSKKTPSAPFTTSTLQQEASRKLWFSVSQTMRVAQKLYEGWHITYMRTDSIAMSDTAISNAIQAIGNRFGADVVSSRKFVNKKSSAQEAHECIRPTDFSRDIAGEDAQGQKLYRLIRQRSIATQMADAQCEKTVVKIKVSEAPTWFTASGEVIKSPWFLLAYGIDGKSKIITDESDEESSDDISNQWLPPLTKGQELDLHKMTVMTNYDRYPARYTEASLVKKLEAEGIGRPSTYAPTISTILKRWYVVQEDREWVMKEFQKLELFKGEITEEVIKKPYGAERKKLFPTDTGMVVTDFLIEHFPSIVDYGFTAAIEQEFDEIAEGGRDWTKMMDAFYKPFHALIVQAGGEAPRASGERLLGVDPKTNKQISVRLGRFGAFVQKWESDDTDKVYASLKSWLRLDTITLEEALSCFDLPRKLWLYEEKELVVNIGRFGPYVKYGDLFVSLGKDNDPYSIDFDTAVALVQQKIQGDKDKLLHTFLYTDNTECRVEQGRYGPFIRYGKLNIKIPKDVQEKIKKMSDKNWIKLVDEGKAWAMAPKQAWGRKK